MPLDDLFTLIKDLRERMDTHGAALRTERGPHPLRAHRPPVARARLEHRGPRPRGPRVPVGQRLGGLRPPRQRQTPHDGRGQEAGHAPQGRGRAGDPILSHSGHRPLLRDRRQTLGDLRDTQTRPHRRQANCLLRPEGAGPRGGGPAGAGALEARRASGPRRPRPRSGPRTACCQIRRSSAPAGRVRMAAAIGAEPSAHSAPPDGNPVPRQFHHPATAWNSILIETVRWLINGNYLTATHCPIRRETAQDTSGCHPRSFERAPVQDLAAHRSVRCMLRRTGLPGSTPSSATDLIVERLGQDPSQFHVGFAPPK